MRVRNLPKVRQGAHVVEMAFVLPVYFLFIFALIDFGRGMMVNSLLTNAAREGCRVGCLPGRSTDQIKSAVTSVLKGVTDATTTVTVNGAALDAQYAETRDLISVTVTAPVDKNTWMPGGNWMVKGTFSGTFAMPRE